MNNKTIFAALLALFATACQNQKIKCHIDGTVAEGTQANELVIYRDGTDPKDSPMRLTVTNGRFACDIEDSHIERYNIVDYGEVLDKGHTSRGDEFFCEDGATITINLNSDEFEVTSTGSEFQQWQGMQKAAMEKFMPAYEALDENDEAAMAELENEYGQWTLDYFANHPMLGFLLELDKRLNQFHFNDESLTSMLDIYHQHYTKFYANHPVHQRIAEQEAVGYQIYGRKYNDYDVRTMDGQQVRASDYYQGHPTVVVCWASWCAPCIREANDVIPIYNQYHDRGLNFFSLSHEYKSADAMRSVVERSGFPWPCLVDIDDEFGVFKRHGTNNSAIFLIDSNGNIVAVPNSADELKMELEKMFGGE